MTDYIKKIGSLGIQIVDGDITQIPTDAIMTAINSGGMWFGGVDCAIMSTAGGLYHDQAYTNMPLKDLDVVVAKGNKNYHNGQFNDVVFVVDDLQSPLDRVIYQGLEAAHNESYSAIVLPTVRMGVMSGVVEKTPREAVERLAEGVERFMSTYGQETSLQDLTIVTFRDLDSKRTLESVLSKQ